MAQDCPLRTWRFYRDTGKRSSAALFAYTYRAAYNEHTFASGQALIYDSPELDGSGWDALGMTQMVAIACGVITVLFIAGAIIGFRRRT